MLKRDSLNKTFETFGHMSEISGTQPKKIVCSKDTKVQMGKDWYAYPVTASDNSAKRFYKVS